MARIQRWTPEDPKFWQETGSALAWRTCGVTTFSLIFSFATWFVMSAVVVRMPAIGFKFTTTELFWLAAIPGLASGILRLGDGRVVLHRRQYGREPAGVGRALLVEGRSGEG